MKLYTVLLSITIVSLSSCAPMVASSRTMSPPTSTVTAVATESVNPMQIQTPINTPHGFASGIGRVTLQESFELFEERVNDFENKLRFTVRILDVQVYSTNPTFYVMKTEGIITNISDVPLVVKKSLRSGFVIDPEVYWSYTYNGKKLDYVDCCIDGWVHVQQDDYIVLEPNEFQIYTWAVSVPLTLPDSKQEEVSLSGKPVTVTATFINPRVGLSLEDENGNLVSNSDESGEATSYVIDMNAWVGTVTSNSIEYVFP